MTLPDLSDTIVALATPPGTGAIAVIRLAGPEAIALADRMFKGRVLAGQATHTAHFGRIEDPADGKAVDEVLVTLFRAPRSYTGDDAVEISCHGSPYIQQEIIRICLQQGARLAQPGEFTLRAFLNGKIDLSQAEAVADLIASQSGAAHDVALRQLRGGFRTEISRLREELIHFASLVELELDFSEEDVEFANRSDLKALVEKIRQYTQSLLGTFRLGNALKTGVATVIAGRPNAGKSTLLNALLNEERAIVSDIAGTTRDTIEEALNIRGVQFRLIDTAGIREAQDAIEAIGVQRTMEKVREASVLCYVWDVAGGMTLADLFADLKKLDHEDVKLLVLCNKMDRNPYFQAEWLSDPLQPGIHPYLLGDPPADLSAFAGFLSQEQIVPISAKHQQNIAFLKEKLFELVVGGELEPDATIVTNARHYDALRRADESLGEVLDGLERGITGDFIAMDIRRALNFLGEITGEIGVEDLLGNIFGKFCVGK
ncbi:MAG: tRNA uridine-5-carboxymethylaminomethyl(34) synthesis GTPase MnmE [Lewinellaceae bacterium]|nr:tRNA uridine-5-carboxymethylaminomethyl(34) synthesis GTPase MnmE [Saprospiraceae bacterium]MCB9355398.1 tRNA uridine-5-carboxymethylaminomethyl(34) synthesis GTPase MnmE [Lewinellaceae bacterium]